jgi:hypothetical protein
LKTTAIFSLARIVATLGVFLYHALNMLEIDVGKFLGFGNNYFVVGLPSILIFFFLSANLASFGVKEQRLNWLVRRVSSIMIPYWFVIVPVVIINRFVLYKETTALIDLASVLGLNLFLENPLYTIGWFITLINLLYLAVFLQSLSKSATVRLAVWALGGICMVYLWDMSSYFLTFTLGYLSSRIIPRPKKNHSSMAIRDRILFVVQDKCYAFFLLHGAVLNFLFVKLDMTGFDLIGWGVVFTSVGAILLRKITIPLIKGACGLFAKQNRG